jgi:hypothetical protein
MHQKHSEFLDSSQGLTAIGQAYLKNPIPLITQDQDQGSIVDMGCVVPIILTQYTEGRWQNPRQADSVTFINRQL